MTDFTVRPATVADKEEIYDVLVDSYFADMPLFAACNMTKPPPIDVWPAIQELANGLSVVAVNGRSEIIGVAVNTVPKGGGEVVGLPEEIEKFFLSVEEKSNGLFTELERTAMEINILAVLKAWRRKGVSKRLIQESEKMAKQNGWSKVFAISTGAFMEASFAKQNLEKIYKYYYVDHLNVDKDFKLPSAPHDSITFFQKIL